MNFLKEIASTSCKVIGKIKVKSPEVLIGVGIACVGTGFVLTIRNTLKCKDEVTAHQKVIEDYKAEKAAVADTREYRKDLTQLYGQKALIIVRNYAGPVCFVAGGVASILWSYGIMKRRLGAVIAAYGLLDESFKKYRERVREELGEDRERQLYLGQKKVKSLEVVEEDENGNEKKIKVSNGMTIADPSQVSEYARFFDESSACWQKSAEYNKMFLIQMQNRLNDKLHAVGHLFLNEVYEALGFEHTQAGAVVGWVMGNGDDFVDFGIYDVYTSPRRAAFVNGYERSVLLDFNVDGLIVDKI